MGSARGGAFAMRDTLSRMRTSILSALLGVFVLGVAPGSLQAAPILAPPGDPAFDMTVAALASGYQRQQDVFATLENGLSLDVFFRPEDVQAVKDFFAQSATDDFKASSGKHPYEAMLSFDEHGDEGNFAGIAS